MTCTRLKKSGMIVRGSVGIDEAKDEIFGDLVERAEGEVRRRTILTRGTP